MISILMPEYHDLILDVVECDGGPRGYPCTTGCLGHSLPFSNELVLAVPLLPDVQEVARWEVKAPGCPLDPIEIRHYRTATRFVDEDYKPIQVHVVLVYDFETGGPLVRLFPTPEAAQTAIGHVLSQPWNCTCCEDVVRSNERKA